MSACGATVVLGGIGALRCGAPLPRPVCPFDRPAGCGAGDAEPAPEPVVRVRKLTRPQRVTLTILRSEPGRGFPVDELARGLGTTPAGAAATASSLVRHGLAVRFVSALGGVRRVHYQATP